MILVQGESTFGAIDVKEKELKKKYRTTAPKKLNKID